MGKLILKLDEPLIYCVVESGQLLLAEELKSTNVSQILAKIGDYHISEVVVYAKFDTRQDLDGIAVDRICSDEMDKTFYLAESDYIFLKALSHRFGAAKLSIYSAYRHYAVLIETGIVVDTFRDNHFIVAAFIDGEYQSLNICSSDMLRRTIEQCQLGEVIYASYKIIPQLGNIDAVPIEMYETLSFLQFSLHGKPCYEVDIMSGIVTEYADMARRQRVLTEEEVEFFTNELLRVMGPKQANPKRKFSFYDIYLAVAGLLIGALLGVALLGLNQLNPHMIALQTRVSEQRREQDRQGREERFLDYSISDPSSGYFFEYLMHLDSIVSSGQILSVRFAFDMMELSVLVPNEQMFNKVLTEISSYYSVLSGDFIEVITNPNTGASYLQYNVWIDLILVE